MTEAPRFLVTGMQGFVGQRLTTALKSHFIGCEVFGLGGDGITGQIESEADTHAAAMKVPDVVFHLAARSSVAQSTNSAAQTTCVNLGGTLCLARALRIHAPRAAMIYASSGETYGNSFMSGLAACESTPLQPQSPYARSKAAGEWAVQDMLSDQAAVISLRLFNHSGAGQDERFVLPSFAAQIAQIEAGKAVPIIKVGNLSAKRDFLHVDDVIDAYIAVAHRSMGLAPSFQAYNVCSGVAIKIEDLLAKLISLSDKKITIEVDEDRLRPSDIACAFGDNSAFKTSFDWTPKRPISEMLADVLTYARQHKASGSAP